MANQGTCTQRHFPAVAQPFRILWAPWSAALFFFFAAMMTSFLLMAIFGSSVGGAAMPVLVMVGHGLAISIGIKMRYLASIVGGLENRRTGATNLKTKVDGKKETPFEFANI